MASQIRLSFLSTTAGKFLHVADSVQLTQSLTEQLNVSQCASNSSQGSCPYAWSVPTRTPLSVAHRGELRSCHGSLHRFQRSVCGVEVTVPCFLEARD